MSTGTKSRSVSPFRAIRGAWTAMGAPFEIRRYLEPTLGSLLQPLLRAPEIAGEGVGLVHIPKRVLALGANGTVSPENTGTMLLVSGPGSGSWSRLAWETSIRTALFRDIWAIWAGEGGSVLLTAQRERSRRGAGVQPEPSWILVLSSERDAVTKGAQLLAELTEKATDLAPLWEALLKRLTMEPAPTNGDTLRSAVWAALALADRYDPWTRKRLMQSAWTSLVQRVHEAVAWELRIERLLPTVGSILRGTLRPDFLEIHIFERVGKRFEEFISWRKNHTGVGGDQMSLLLSESLVANVLRVRRPRLIQTTHEDGLMNPHLAQLAGLKEGLIIPLVHGRNVEGLMTLYYRRPTEFGEEEMDHIAQIGRTIALSVNNTNAHERVHRMATMDALTGLFNRRFFTEQLRREFKRSRRHGSPLALIMIDVDNFKNYNDTNGHLMGDTVLKLFARIAKSSVREEDIVARYGGEEFAVVLPQTDSKRGLIVAEKLREEVANTPFPNGEKQPLGLVSVSLGVADTHGDLRSPEDLIRRADTALYRAKESGRNRSEVYDPSLDSSS